MKTAVVIEDDFIIGLYLKKQLEKFNVQVVDTIDRGEDVEASVVKHQPDLIFIDVALGGSMDGIEAASKLSGENKPDLVFITGTSDKETIERIRALKPLALLSKPVDTGAFKKILNGIGP